MKLEEKNAIFTKDNEGVMILTDITDMPAIVSGEAVYDGKNAIVLNRNNQHYFVLKNIPPYIREALNKSEDVTIIEKRQKEDIYSYSVKIRKVDDMEIPDEWRRYSEQIMKNLKENLTAQEYENFLSEAKTIYDTMAK
ncbi:MAG: hypothetical protein J6Y53_06100 [Alphaproteobacteria bacterium]|nr:hypothetical protein [Alphaproteobacteria bacterium]